jgi:hypothetical protein
MYVYYLLQRTVHCCLVYLPCLHSSLSDFHSRPGSADLDLAVTLMAHCLDRSVEDSLRKIEGNNVSAAAVLDGLLPGCHTLHV